MSLNSKTTIKVIDLICEGPIEGIQGRKGVFLNETPAGDKKVQKEDFERRDGFRNQKRFEGETSIVTPQVVGLQVGDNYSETLNASNEVTDRDYGPGSVIQTVTDLEADSVELIFTVPRLYSTAVEGLARGQLFPARIRMEVEIQNSGGGYVTRFTKEIEGISTSGYQFKTPKIDLLKDFLPGVTGPWNIKVRKRKFENAEDAFEIKKTDLVDLPQEKTSLQQGRGDVLEWSQILVHKDVKVNYRGTACAALSLDAEQFQSLPSRAYDVKGRRVAIPSNATPHKDGYLQFSSLPFDGRLKSKAAWTTCPVCCFYDMLINKRYGAGDFINVDNISWIDLIPIAKYCNELIDVPGGTEVPLGPYPPGVEPPEPKLQEPRFAINTVIGNQADAYSVIQDLASVFRGMVFWKADTVQLAADHGNLDGSNLDPIHVFTNSNVVEGSFVYSGSSLKTRSTRVVARYNDPGNFYKPNYIIVEDKNAISKYGLQTREIVAFGCTSKTQAQRMAKWVMTSEELEGETITFSVGLEGLNVLPGQIFAVSDAMRQGSRLAGRVVGATRRKIIADQNVSSLPGSNDQLTVVLPDGRVQVRAATLDGTSTITVSPKFDEPPADNAVWTITDTSVANQKFRCLSVAEGEDGVYSIVGVQHVDNIYDVVEGKNSALDFADTTLFDDAPNKPTNLQIRFFDITRDRNRFKQINISWSRGTDSRAVKFLVKYKITDSGNVRQISTTNTNIDVSDSVLANQKVSVEIIAIGPEPDNKRSEPAEASAFAVPANVSDVIDGGTVQNRPPDPEEVTLEPIGKDQVIVRWSPTANGQNLDEFVAVIRHSGKTDGSGIWYKSNLLRKVEARTTYASLPMLEGEYLVKFENDQGVRSLNAASAVINLPDQLPLFNYESIQAAISGFPGLKDGVYFDDGFDGLVLDGDASFDDEVSNLDALTANIDSIFGTQRTSGTYYFAMGFDFSAKYSPLFKRTLDSVGIYRTNTFDDRLDLIDTWSDFDGEIADDTNVEIYLRTATTALDRTDDFVDTEDGSSLQLETADNFLNDSNLNFGPWVPLENTSFAGRYFQFKAVLTTDNVDQSPSVEGLAIDVKFERRTEHSENVIESGYGAKTENFKYPFYTDANTDASVGIIAYDMQPGDYFTLGEPTSTGFTVTFKGGASGTTLINRRFRYTAVGYGTKQP
nr:phage-related protein tail component-like protein [uncultured Mediterranean phage uvMED]